MLAAYKIRAVPINVNYRYVEDELRYLFDNADLVALVFERGVRAPRRRRCAPDLPDAAPPRGRRGRDRRRPRAAARSARSAYEDALAAASPRARLRAALAPTTSTSSTPAARPACPRA